LQPFDAHSQHSQAAVGLGLLQRLLVMTEELLLMLYFQDDSTMMVAESQN
jgi:hypothetical protein